MFHDRGFKLAVIEEKQINLEGVSVPKFVDKKLVDEFTKDFKEKMRLKKISSLS